MAVCCFIILAGKCLGDCIVVFNIIMYYEGCSYITSCQSYGLKTIKVQGRIQEGCGAHAPPPRPPPRKMMTSLIDININILDMVNFRFA